MVVASGAVGVKLSTGIHSVIAGDEPGKKIREILWYIILQLLSNFEATRSRNIVCTIVIPNPFEMCAIPGNNEEVIQKSNNLML